MIFLAIAGGYTGYCAVALPSSLATVILVIVWAGALAGVGLQLLWPFAPRWLSAPSYAALGMVAVFVLPELLRHGGVVALALLCTGGGVYLLGALAYAPAGPTRCRQPLASTRSSTPAPCSRRPATTSACGSRSTPDLAPARHLVATYGTAASANEHADLRERRCRPPAHALARDRPARPPAALPGHPGSAGQPAGVVDWSTGCNNGCRAGPASRPAEGRAELAW